MHNYPQLACNGIVIESNDSRDGLWEFLRLPKISVFDRDGRLPVNLQRTGLQDSLPFKDELLASMAEDICAHALTEAPAVCDERWFNGQYEGFARQTENVYHPEWARWLIARTGFVLNEPNLLASFRPRTILVAIGGRPGYQGWGEAIRRQLPDDTLIVSALPHVFSDTNPRIKGLVRRAIDGSVGSPRGIKGSTTTAYVPKTLVGKMKELRPGKEVQVYLETLEASKVRNGWVRTEIHANTSRAALDHAITGLTVDKENPVLFYLVDVKELTGSDISRPLTNRWMEICGTPVVPFDQKERIRLEHKATNQISKVLQARRKAEKERKKKQAERENQE
jgi:hypothetical protein